MAVSPTDQSVPKPEYPRPQMVRERWLSLNGVWQFEIDRGNSGLQRGLHERELDSTILVPFAPESVLSGIHDVDFLEAVWYRREVQIPRDWADQQILLHFGAVDHDATVWIDSVEVARHRGGFSPFTAVLPTGSAGASITITVRARDTATAPQARGKQSRSFQNEGADYNRTTGIWQTVWLEPVPVLHFGRPRITPDVANSRFLIEMPLADNATGHRITAILSDSHGEVSRVSVNADQDRSPLLIADIPDDRVRLWAPGDGHLYGLVVELTSASGELVDRIESYAGLRSVSISGRRILINGKPVFQRLVLDQGYWPDSLMTSPDDAALIRDIQLGLAAGFNGARMHQKVFEERYLYHADRLGYLTWGEFGDWGVNVDGPELDHQHHTVSYTTQWLEVLERDYSHPSIVGWCPLNETSQLLHDSITVLDDVTRGMFLATKATDRTRPVLDTSGYSHRVAETEVWDAHNYEQDPRKFREQVGQLAAGTVFENRMDDGRPMSIAYAGQPYFISEFGGIWWNPDREQVSGRDTTESWGYGERIVNEEQFYARFDGLTGVLLGDPEMFGYCYTQLTDVFQEENGIYRFDRSEKLDTSRVHASQVRIAAYEIESTAMSGSSPSA